MTRMPWSWRSRRSTLPTPLPARPGRCDYRSPSRDGWGNAPCLLLASVRFSLDGQQWCRCAQHAEVLRKEYRGFPDLTEEPM